MTNKVPMGRHPCEKVMLDEMWTLVTARVVDHRSPTLMADELWHWTPIRDGITAVIGDHKQRETT